MANEVDDKIVELKFNNADFQQKLAATLTSLEQLRTKLNMTESAKGLDAISKSSNNVDMGGLGSKVEAVAQKFTALSVVAVAALATIASKAVSSAAQFVSSFTFGPIRDGLAEFETNMNSIQTILANTQSKGSTLDDVNKALADLNAYSDRTIYNFSQMARNIGTFTAAGVGLEASTSAIKGIANLAAISGSNADQASTAMYQLSQALASGSVKLMDWNSVVNAGMGGEVFQKALFNTGKQLNTIKNVPMGQTFEQWKAAGNTFRDSLKDGWITADVLTNTLSQFTGDLTDAQLKSQGYNDEQIQQIQQMAKTANHAAQDVKTFSQLVGTVKEAIGSGWTQTFQILIGNFDEAKKLFTDMSNAIGGFVGASAKARNEMLQSWKDVGGRTLLIDTLKSALKSVGNVLEQISQAFREFFPKTTAQDLTKMTYAFSRFVEAMKPSDKTLESINNIFRGLFSTLKVGWEVVKGVTGVLGELIGTFAHGGGDVFTGIAKGAGSLADFNEKVLASGAIPAFFEHLKDVIMAPIEFIEHITDAVVNFFNSFVHSKEAGDAVDRVGDRFGALETIVTRVMQVIGGIGAGIVKAMQWVGEQIKDFLDKVLQPDDFDNAVDAVNVGLLGGIALLLKKFMNGGLKIDFGGGVFDKVKDSLDQLTGTLHAMQTNLKANALLKIAGAIGILTASVVALSMIDSDKLTKAMIGMGVGFGQLIAVMTVLDKAVGSSMSAVKLGILSAGLIGLASAMAILSLAIKNLSTLSWGELAKGLIGVGGGLALMIASVNLMTTDTAGLIRAGVAMGAIATAMYILAQAMQAFGTMSWGEMAKGMVGVAGGLVLITGAMQLMPVSSTLAAGAAMIPLATGLLILSQAVQSFATMGWAEMAKGLIGMGTGLVAIAGAMQLMPINLPITAAGMVILSGALVILSKAVQSMGEIKFGDMVKGIGGLAAMLAILASAMIVMQGTLGGAAALAVVSVSLLALTKVLEELAKLSIGQLVTALAALAGVFIVLGGAALLLEPLVPALMGIGVALGLIGGSFALFGAGIMLVAKGFEILAKSGEKGAVAIVKLIGVLFTARIKIAEALFDAIKMFAMDVINAAPLIVKAIRVLLDELLKTIITEVPKIAEALAVIITNALALIRAKFPDLLATGFDILKTLLAGIASNIGEITNSAIDIVVGFAAAIVSNMGRLVSAGVALIGAFLDELSKHAVELAAAGLGFLVSLIAGITDNINKVVDAVANIITTFLINIAAGMMQIIDAGTNILIWLLDGIANNIVKVADKVTDILTKFLDTLDENTQKIIDAGFKLLTDFLSGIGNNMIKVTEKVGDIITTFLKALTDKTQDIINAGADLIVTILKGISDNIQKIIDAGGDLIIKFIQGIGEKSVEITNAALDVLVDFINGMADAINTHRKELQDAGKNLALAIADGLTMGLASKTKDVVDGAVGLGKKMWNGITGFFDSHSPSRLMMKLGGYLGDGLAIGMDNNTSAEDSAETLADKIVAAFQKILDKVQELLDKLMDQIDSNQPVIKPIVDQSQIESASKAIQALMDQATAANSSMKTNFSQTAQDAAATAQNGGAPTQTLAQILGTTSAAQAKLIATTSPDTGRGDIRSPQTASKTVVFNQNNYSPKALTATDIYRNTNSQIAMAKEELKI